MNLPEGLASRSIYTGGRTIACKKGELEISQHRGLVRDGLEAVVVQTLTICCQTDPNCEVILIDVQLECIRISFKLQRKSYDCDLHQYQRLVP